MPHNIHFADGTILTEEEFEEMGYLNGKDILELPNVPDVYASWENYPSFEADKIRDNDACEKITRRICHYLCDDKK